MTPAPPPTAHLCKTETLNYKQCRRAQDSKGRCMLIPGTSSAWPLTSGRQLENMSGPSWGLSSGPFFCTFQFPVCQKDIFGLKLTVKSVPRPESLAGRTSLCLRDADLSQRLPQWLAWKGTCSCCSGRFSGRAHPRRKKKKNDPGRLSESREAMSELTTLPSRFI